MSRVNLDRYRKKVGVSDLLSNHVAVTGAWFFRGQSVMIAKCDEAFLREVDNRGCAFR